MKYFRRDYSIRVLSLGLEDDGEERLENILVKNFQPEAFIGENSLYCEKCDKKCPGSKRSRIIQVPQVLALTLKRFKYDQKLGDLKKIDREIFYKANGVSLPLQVCEVAVKMELFAVIVKLAWLVSSRQHKQRPLLCHSQKSEWKLVLLQWPQSNESRRSSSLNWSSLTKMPTFSSTRRRTMNWLIARCLHPWKYRTLRSANLMALRKAIQIKCQKERLSCVLESAWTTSTLTGDFESTERRLNLLDINQPKRNSRF